MQAKSETGACLHSRREDTPQKKEVCVKPVAVKKISNTPEPSGETLAERVVQIAHDGKALDVAAFDVRGIVGYADYIVIASGTSDRHVQSVAEAVAKSVAAEGVHILGTEGLRSGHWALIDCGDVVVHVFHQFTRDVYNLEELWPGAKKLRC